MSVFIRLLHRSVGIDLKAPEVTFMNKRMEGSWQIGTKGDTYWRVEVGAKGGGEESRERNIVLLLETLLTEFESN